MIFQYPTLFSVIKNTHEINKVVTHLAIQRTSSDLLASNTFCGYSCDQITTIRHTKITFLLFIAVSLFLHDFLYCHPVSAAEPVRTQEISECRQNELVTWGDGHDRPVTSSKLKFMYNHHNAPMQFSESLVTGMVAKAATAWSQCGIQAKIVRWPLTDYRQKDTILVQWDEKESRGNFALANLTQRTLSLSPKGFEMLRERNPSYDASQTLQMAISHEMGHFFGLMAHSRRCVDVMSYYHNGRGEKCFKRSQQTANSVNRVVEYRHLLPTACDIERCRKVNGKPPLPGGRLAP